MAADSAGRHSDLAVMNAQEYKQKRRLRSILDAHDNVEDVAAEAYRQYISREISEEGKDIVILRSVKRQIREVHNLLIEHHEKADEQNTKDYWAETEIGRIEFSDGSDVKFVGLKDILWADDIYVATWEEPLSTRHGPNGSETRTEHKAVPEDISFRAYLLLNEFAGRERSLDLQFQDLDDSRPFLDWAEGADDEL